jgi:hypothetical protein
MLDSPGTGRATATGVHYYENYSVGSIKCKGFLERLSDYWLLNEDYDA